VRRRRPGTPPPPAEGTRGGSPWAGALSALGTLPAGEQLEEAIARLHGRAGGPLASFGVASERSPTRGRLDGRLLEAIAARALGGARGAVFTRPPEARLLSAFGLAHAAARRGGPAPAAGVASLLAGGRDQRLAAALEGLTVLDPACGGGALLAAAARLALGVGARVRLRGLELSPLAARAASARLALLEAGAEVTAGDAFSAPFPRADVLLMNPPFLRHEAVPAREKARAARASGLSRQADLSAHFTLAALRAAPVCALVWPEGLGTARSAAPLLAEARARGGFVLSLRSHAAGSFAASVETRLAVWAEGGTDAPEGEATVPLAELTDEEAVALARGVGSGHVRLRRRRPPPPRGAALLGDVSEVRFGTKSGCNAFFHLVPLGGDRYRSALAGQVALSPEDVVPLLASLKEARAPELAEPARVLFRPRSETGTARAYVRQGEALGVHRRATCAGRSTWWRLVPGRTPAPILYPAKVGARAFAFLNEARLWEDKKWHVLFPRDGVDPAAVALLLGATPVRLAIDEGARQLTGKQAIADVDCRVLAAAPFPSRPAIEAVSAALAALRPTLARDPISTDLPAMLDRPAQRELDLLCAHAMGMAAPALKRARRELLLRVERRLARAAAIRDSLVRVG
jgi:SAM-dependent methyltransferase